ncbi:MAG: DGQHR domain-containing protein [Gemmatimonadales bacterium]
MQRQLEPEFSTREFAIPVSVGELPAAKIQIVVGVMPAAAVYERFVIPRRDSRKKTGYQREPSTTRVNRLATELKRARVSLPTAVLLNLRSFNPNLHLQTLDDHHRFRPNEEDLYVVDGQHRILALEKLIIDAPQDWSSYPLPFVCMLGADDRQEMEQFYVVNSTAKSVRTDLAFDILKQRAESDPVLLEGLTERGEDWKVKAQALVEILAESPVWKGRVRFPGEPKADTTINSSGLATSFKSLLDTPFFGSISNTDRGKILDAYWRGIREILRPAFDEPHRYAVQKSVGVMALHNLLISVVEYIRSRGDSVLESDSFTKAMRNPLEKMQGESAAGEPVTGLDFWLAGTQGAAGAYSSNAGRRVLIARLRGLLPRIEVE